MPSSLRAVLAALCALLLASSVAGAATPIVLDANTAANRPSVVVDSSGTSHIAWNVSRTIGLGDRIVYCRLPRGASACSPAASTTTFLPDFRQSEWAPSIFLRGTGVVIASGRFDGSSTATWVAVSSNLTGGPFATREAGDVNAARTVLGPGTNAITSISPAPGPLGSTRVQVASLVNGDPKQTASAAFPANGISFDPLFRAGLGYINPSIPAFTYQDDSGTWMRRYDSLKPTTTGGYNTGANWLPAQPVSGERESSFASDPNSGAYLLTKFQPHGDSDTAFQERRIDETNGAFGTPKLATEIGPPNEAAFTVNSEGRRTVVWNSVSDGPLKAATATTGSGFSSPSTLVPSLSSFNLNVGSAPDGGGLAVWDGNSGAGISAVAIPVGGPVPDPTPTPPPGATPGPAATPTPIPDVSETCKLTLAPGVVARARGGVSGCWVNKPGSKQYTYEGTVDVNGVILTAAAGKGSGVKVDLGKSSLSSAKGTQVKAGSLVLGSSAVQWSFSKPGAGGRYVQAPFTNLQKAGPGGKAVNLLGFEVRGEAALSFGNGDAYITPNLAMPFPFDADGLTAATTIRVTPNEGLNLEGLEFSIENATIGPVQVKKLHVRATNGGGDFLGEAQAVLPATGKELAVVVRFSDGNLTQFAAQASGLNVPLGPVVTLNGVGFDYVNDATKFGVAGGADLAFPSATGPFWLNALPSPSNGTGGFRVEINKAKRTAVVRFDGQFQFGGQPYDSRFTFGRFGLGLDTEKTLLNGFVNVGIGNDTVGIRGEIKGAVNYGQAAFFFEGKITACLLGCVDLVKVYAGGSKSLEGGVGGCLAIPLLVTDLELSVGYKWKTGFDAGLSCDQESYKPAAFKAPGTPEPKVPDPRPLVISADTFSLPFHPAVGGGPTKLGKGVSVAPDEDLVWSAEVKGKPGGGAPAIAITEVPLTKKEAGGVITLEQSPESPTDRVVIASDPSTPNAPVGVRDVVLVPNPETDSVRLTFVQRGTKSIGKIASNVPHVMRIKSTGANPIQLVQRTAGSKGAHRLQASGGITFALNYDASKVTGSLGGKARKRTIRWSATNLAGPGRTVELVEADASGTLKVIKRSKAATGSASWSIADGPGGRRIVRALVRNFDGTVVGQFDLANFIAPPTPKPTKAKRLRFKLGKGGKLAVSWAGPKNAANTLVQVKVADGRGYLVTTKKRSLTIPGVAAKEKVTVTVTGVTKAGVRGPAASVKR